MKLNCRRGNRIRHSRRLIKRPVTGFTLLEMLLTVFLIGLISSLVVLNVNQNADDIAKLEARRFAALVSHLQDESTISGLPMGIEVRAIENRYSFWELLDEWVLIDKQEVLRERIVPDEVTVTFTLLQEDEAQPEPKADPQQENIDSQGAEIMQDGAARKPNNLLLVDPTGIIRPFIASFGGDKKVFDVSLDNDLNPVVTDG